MVESVRWEEGEETVETVEGEITLKVEGREVKFESLCFNSIFIDS
jgi:hypothetical protein